MPAGPGHHCRPGPAVAPHTRRPDPTASAQSASAAHQPPHCAGGAQELADSDLPSALLTVMIMHITLAAVIDCATADNMNLGSLSQVTIAKVSAAEAPEG